MPNNGMLPTPQCDAADAGRGGTTGQGSSMWSTRERSLQALKTELAAQERALASSFGVLDECLGRFSARMGSSEFHRACGLVAAKARHLVHAQYSLALEGLAQEAGALLRPLIECFELLTYFEEAPARVREAVEGRLPSAGKIAKAIAGSFRLPDRRWLTR
jgi:hypothetical protein